MKVYFPPSLQRFSPKFPLQDPWFEHASFGYDLVEAMRPRLVVEIGTQSGASHFTFCQSIKDHGLGGLCYAFGLWPEDQASQPSGESTTTDELNRRNRDFSDFSYMARMDGDQALKHFNEASIDLLHIQEVQLPGSFAAGFDRWLEKVKPGGVVLLHHVQPDSGHPDVQQHWHRVAERHPSFVFTRGTGLGVLRKVPVPPAGVEPLLLQHLFSRVEQDRQQMQEFYRYAAQYYTLKRNFGKMVIAASMASSQNPQGRKKTGSKLVRLLHR